jgi:hypothetical protein
MQSLIIAVAATCVLLAGLLIYRSAMLVGRRLRRKTPPSGLPTSRAMSKDEMSTILSEHLAKFRTWSYAQLAERVERDRQAHECLEHVEGIADDGTQYYVEFQAYWDDKPHGAIRVCGDLSAQPQRPLLGFIPIYMPDVTDSFIMGSDGRFVDEHETPVA